MPKVEIWTIGHSTLLIDNFIEMLQYFKIEILADIRSYPGSRRYPHFNKEVLAKTLAEQGINYIHLISLGGRRKALKDSVHTEWRNSSFRGYADYMDSSEFAEGIKEVLQLAKTNRTAIMCAEAYWRECHRSMVADHLKSMGVEVCHITGTNKCEAHSYTEPYRSMHERD